MTCTKMMIGGTRTILCSPTVSARTKETVYCRDCQKLAKHVIEVRDWYGLVRCCLKCGRVQTNEGDGWRYAALPGGYDAAKQRAHNIKTWSDKPIFGKETT